MEQRVRVCACVCTQPPQRCSGPSAHGAVARRGPGAQLSDVFFALLDSGFRFFSSLSTFFPLFIAFIIPTPGAGDVRQGTLVAVAPAAPGAQSRRPPGAKQPLPERTHGGGSTTRAFPAAERLLPGAGKGFLKGERV